MENCLWRDENIIICWNSSIVFARYNLASVLNGGKSIRKKCNSDNFAIHQLSRKIFSNAFMLFKLLLKRIYYVTLTIILLLFIILLYFMVGLLWSFCLWLNMLRAIFR